MTVLTMLVAIMLMMIMAMLIKVTGIDRRWRCWRWCLYATNVPSLVTFSAHFSICRACQSISIQGGSLIRSSLVDWLAPCADILWRVPRWQRWKIIRIWVCIIWLVGWLVYAVIIWLVGWYYDINWCASFGWLVYAVSIWLVCWYCWWMMILCWWMMILCWYSADLCWLCWFLWDAFSMLIYSDVMLIMLILWEAFSMLIYADIMLIYAYGASYYASWLVYAVIIWLVCWYIPT